MFKEIICFLALTSIKYSLCNNLLWNTKKPYRYTGFIYTDSKIATIDPTLQVLIKDGEEICNFKLKLSSYSRDSIRINPFRAVVKSARLGLGEIELVPNASLKNQSNVNYDLEITAEACHNPDSWSESANLSLKVLDPPEPIWTKSPYSASINNDAIIGTFVIQVTAYLPTWADPDNRICEYRLKQSQNNPFAIDGSGTITTRENLMNIETVYVALDVIAEDCSLPIHRQSKVSVFVTIYPICKFGWTGFYKQLGYLSGSGVALLGKKLKFEFCKKDSNESFSEFIGNCRTKEAFRVTVSVELKSVPRSNLEMRINENNICYLDYESLKIQRKICDIQDNRLVDLLSTVNKQKTGVMKFPLQIDMFPGLIMAPERKFSLYFWMRRKTPDENLDECIVCQLNKFGKKEYAVSISSCKLRIFLYSNQDVNIDSQFEETLSLILEFNLPQTCDDKWHHYLIINSDETETSPDSQVRLFVDAEAIENKNRVRDINMGGFSNSESSDRNNFFVGHCSKNSNTLLTGYLSGLILLPNRTLKSSNARCLMKCMERLHFNGMNQMNPGMSVSLNSEMQTIIINGHNVDEVGRLVEVIGYTNPKWDPISGVRLVSITTDMSCGKRIFNVPSVEVSVNVTKQSHTQTIQKLITSIKLVTNYTSIYISNMNVLQSTTGIGLGIFENTTLSVMGISQSTVDTISEDTLKISRCIISIHPELIPEKEYLEWPQQAIETIRTVTNSMEVRNTSKSIIVFGKFNQQIYQFIIQHIKYFSSVSPITFHNAYRKFLLQCSADVGMYIINSNMLVVKVFTDSKKPHANIKPIITNHERFTKSPLSNIKDFGKQSEILKQVGEMKSHSDAAKHLETDNQPLVNNNVIREPAKFNKNVINYLLGIGIVILMFSLILMARKLRRFQTQDGCVLSFKMIDCICFPLQSIKEKIKPSSTVRVELSRDFLHRYSVKRRDIGLEMQWDDAELKSDSNYHIIENPTYQKCDPEFDDNFYNNDIPPICEVENLTTDDETDEETYSDMGEKIQRNEESIMKKRLIDL